ncbi:hypothetical protein BH09VER1_BH09VER1_18030 [soil metagenome]
MSGCYVVFHKQLGDLLLLEPAIARLRRYHGVPVRIMTRTGHRSLVSLMEGAEYQGGFPIAWKKNLYCFDPLRKSAMRSFFAPTLRRYCILPEKREMEWYHPAMFRRVIVPELGDQYVAKYFWRNTPVPSNADFRTPRLKLPPSGWKPPQMGEESFILVNPTSGWRKKSWLAERWVETLKVLHEQHAIPFVMTSASAGWQIDHCREIADKLDGIVRILERTNLENFLWLCSRARLVLTVDGAASHLAQAFKAPGVTLFGPTNLGNWHSPAKLNLAVQALEENDGVRRMRNLSVSAVLEAISSIKF